MQTPTRGSRSMRSGMKPAVASVALAVTWAVGSDPTMRAFSPLGPASAMADPGAAPPAAEAVRLGDQAVTKQDYAAADALYRVALTSPDFRQTASSRLLALHDLSHFELNPDEKQLFEIQSWLGPRFTRYETAHFVILSDAGRQAALSRGRTMERARHQYFRVIEKLNFPAAPPRTKLLCVFFQSHDDYATFAKDRDNVDTGWIAGYYTGLGNRVVFYDDATSPRFMQARDAIEEYENNSRPRYGTRNRRTPRPRQRLGHPARRLRRRSARTHPRRGPASRSRSRARRRIKNNPRNRPPPRLQHRPPVPRPPLPLLVHRRTRLLLRNRPPRLKLRPRPPNRPPRRRVRKRPRRKQNYPHRRPHQNDRSRPRRHPRPHRRSPLRPGPRSLRLPLRKRTRSHAPTSKHSCANRRANSPASATPNCSSSPSASPPNSNKNSTAPTTNPHPLPPGRGQGEGFPNIRAKPAPPSPPPNSTSAHPSTILIGSHLMRHKTPAQTPLELPER